MGKVGKQLDCSLTRRNFIYLAGVLGVVVACSNAERVRHGPAMWSVRSAGATVILFGQMPLRADVPWLEPALEAAFAGSDVLWLENPDYSRTSPAVMEAVNALARRTAADPEYSILADLGTADAIRLRRVLAEEGMEESSLKGSGPGNVRLILSNIRDGRIGTDVQNIPENVFRSRAEADDMPIKTEWRDLLDVVSWSGDLPRSVQVDFVRLALDDLEAAADYPAELESWKTGELDFQIRQANSIFHSYPELYRRLNSERNEIWVRLIQEMLMDQRQHFVCIGIGHLVGLDSVPSLLRQAGLRVERL